MDFSQQEARFGALTLAQPEKKKLGGLKGAVANFLPTIAGGAGAALGSIAGPVGTIGGGAIGSGLGEYLRQKLTGESDDGIDKGNLVQEAAFGALPGVFKGVKALKTAKAAEGGIEAAGGLRGVLTGGKLTKAATVAEDAAGTAKAMPQTTETAYKATQNGIKTKLATKGQQLEAKAGGFGIGAKQPGQAPLGFGDSEAISKTLADEGIKTGASANRLRSVESKLKTYGSNIDQAVKANNTPLSLSDRSAIAQKYLDNVESLPGVDDTIRAEAENLAANYMKQGKDLASSVNFKRGVDKDLISYISNPDAATAAKQQAATVMRRTINDMVNEAIPDIADLNNRYAGLTEAKSYLTSGAKNPSGIKMFGLNVGGNTKQAIEGTTGKLITKAIEGGAGITVPGAGVAGSVIKGAIPQAGVRAAGSAFGVPFVGSPKQEQAPELPPMPEMSADPSVNPEVTPDDSPFSPANIERNVAKILKSGGTMKEVSEYLAIADKMSSLRPSQKPLSSEAAKTLTNAQTGLSALDDFESAVTKDPGAFARTTIPGTGVLDNISGGRVGSALGTSGIDAASQQIIDVIARLRTGAAISKSEEARFKQFIPRPGDPDNVKAQKIAYLRNQFQDVAARVQNSPSQDLETATLGV